MAKCRSAIFSALAFCASGAALADDWHPAADPYRGTLTQALDTLKDNGVNLYHLAPMAQRALDGRSWPLDTCIVRKLRPGERIALMLSGHGLLRDADVPPNFDTYNKPWTLDCFDHWGNHLLRPEICGNWSWQWISPPHWHSTRASSNDILPQSGDWLPYVAFPYWIGGAGSGIEYANANSTPIEASPKRPTPLTPAAEPSTLRILGVAILLAITLSPLKRK